jgi:hypothetical protein
MFNPSYLCRSRHGVYYLRWPLTKVPNDSGRSTTIKLSIGTRDPKLALILVRSLTQYADELVVWGARRGMRYAEIRGALREHFQQRLDAVKERIANGGRLQPRNLAAFAEGAIWAIVSRSVV